MLGMWLGKRLACWELEVSGMLCPEPTCRLPVDEMAVEAILGAAGRQKFVRLAALRDVDAASGHIAWCPQPGCGKAVARPEGGSAVRCRCGYRALTEPHSGLEPQDFAAAVSFQEAGDGTSQEQC